MEPLKSSCLDQGDLNCTKGTFFSVFCGPLHKGNKVSLRFSLFKLYLNGESFRKGNNTGVCSIGMLMIVCFCSSVLQIEIKANAAADGLITKVNGEVIVPTTEGKTHLYAPFNQLKLVVVFVCGGKNIVNNVLH